jgi:MFS family permease
VTGVRAAGRDTFRSLSIRNFRLFFVGQLISQVGNWLTLIAQTLLVLELTGSGVAIGLLTAAQFGPLLVLGAWAGLVADRSDKRKLMMVVQGVAMLQSFALAALAFMDQPPLAWFYVVALIGGITTAFDNPTRRAFVVEMVPDEDVANAVSLNSALMTSSRVIGPALAGLLVVTVGYGWAFAVDGISYVAVLIALGMIRASELRAPEPAPRGKGQVRDGLRYVRRTPPLFVPLVMMAVIGTFAFNFQVVFPLFAERDLDGSDTTFTVMLSILSVGSLLGALAVGRLRAIRIRTVALAAIAFGVPMLAMAVVPSLPVAYVVSWFLGVGSITFLTSATAIVQLESEPSMRGRVLALQGMVFLGSTPIGGPLLGWVCEAFGARWGVAIGGFACLGAGAWGLACARREPPLRVTPDEARRATEEAEVELAAGTSVGRPWVPSATAVDGGTSPIGQPG